MFRNVTARLASLAICVTFAFATNAWSQTGDTVYYSTGDQNSGKIVSMEKDSLVLETAYAGSLTIRTDALTRVTLDGKEFLAAAFDQLLAAVTARADAQPKPAPPPPTTNSHLPFRKQISGTAGLSFALQQASNSTRSFTADVNLYRASIDKVGSAPRTETGLIYSQNFSSFTSHGSPTQKTESFNVDLSHAMRVKGKYSVFALAAFDHASSEGLDLLQLYASGLAYTGWNNNGNRFEVRAGLDINKRVFTDPKLSQTLFAGLLEEQYAKTFPNGMTIKEQYRLDQAFTHTQDVDGKGSITLDAPISSFLAFRASFNHRYMNVIPKSDKRNALEATFGIDLTIGNGKTASSKGARRKTKKKKK